MQSKSKKIAALATFATLSIVCSIAFTAPAEARRYKSKAVRHQMQQTQQMQQVQMQPNYFGSDVRSPQRPAARGVNRRSAKLANARSSFASAMPSFGGGGLVAEARRYLGTNPTGMGSLWCARFLNMVLERSGRQGTGSNMANSFASYGRRISGPQVGAIAVMSRGKGGGHVGVVSGIDEAGNPIIISGNHNRRVGEAGVPRGGGNGDVLAESGGGFFMSN
jgi:hypothetical protein